MEQEYEGIVDEFMGDNLRAAELREMKAALRTRFDALRRQRAAEPENLALDREIAVLRKQIEAVQREEIVSEFVEASVRASLARPLRQDEEREEKP